jgi:hypothetical protein
MNNEQTLSDLGFLPNPEWDFKETETRHYALVTAEGIVFRAYVQHHNPPVYVIIGKVVNSEGHVARWKDCVSDGSVKRFIDAHIKEL